MGVIRNGPLYTGTKVHHYKHKQDTEEKHPDSTCAYPSKRNRGINDQRLFLLVVENLRAGWTFTIRSKADALPLQVCNGTRTRLHE